MVSYSKFWGGGQIFRSVLAGIFILSLRGDRIEAISMTFEYEEALQVLYGWNVLEKCSVIAKARPQKVTWILLNSLRLQV